MKPEPLTKEKIVEKVLTEYFEGDKKIAKTIIEDEVVDMHNFNIVNFIERTMDITKEEFRKRVEWALKEIDKSYNKLAKEQRELEDKWEYLEDSEKDYLEKIRGALECLEQIKDLIKKAFSGVIEA